MNVQPVVLQGAAIRLEPLSMDHVDAIARFADPSVFMFFGGVVIEGTDRDSVERYVSARLALSSTVSFAMVLQEDGLAVGHSSYMNIRPADKVLEIGSTWIGKPYRGTIVNPEAKLQMLTHAFETLGCVRVELKTDERNLQSQNAMLKLGLVKEGVMRKHCINADGFIRNSVYFSVTDDEWPAMKLRLVARVNALLAG
jgi:RimJ/RimL family protein N-acetyltransferase